MRILTVCGSLQKASGNRELLRVAAATAPAGVEVVDTDALRTLPQFDPDLAASPPAPVLAWRAALANADGVLFASPEYGHSLPGAVKNGIDWVVGSGELNRKVVAITAAVPAPERGRLGLAALRSVLEAVDAIVVGGEPIARGDAFEPGVRALVAVLVAQVQALR